MSYGERSCQHYGTCIIKTNHIINCNTACSEYISNGREPDNLISTESNITAKFNKYCEKYVMDSISVQKKKLTSERRKELRKKRNKRNKNNRK